MKDFISRISDRPITLSLMIAALQKAWLISITDVDVRTLDTMLQRVRAVIEVQD